MWYLRCWNLGHTATKWTTSNFPFTRSDVNSKEVLKYRMWTFGCGTNSRAFTPFPVQSELHNLYWPLTPSECVQEMLEWDVTKVTVIIVKNVSAQNACQVCDTKECTNSRSLVSISYVNNSQDDPSLDLQIADLGMNSDVKVDWTAIRKATVVDIMLVHLAKVIQRGWPESARELPDDVKPYFPYRFMLHIVDGVIAMDGRIISIGLKCKFLEKIQEPHLGIVKSKMSTMTSK